MDRRKEILDYNAEWLRFAETKAVLIITILGIILTVIYTNANDVYIALSISKFQIIFSVFTGVSFFLTLLFCFLTINPKLKNILSKSVIYFGSIKNYKDFTEYNDSLNKITENEYKEMLAEQIYINSKIAWSKFVNIGWAIRCFSAMVLFAFIQVLIYLF